MGIWDNIYSVSDRFKEVAPDLSSVKRVGGSAYNYTSDTVAKIDQVVRVDGIQKLPQYWPDSETRSFIGLLATTLAKNTGEYAVYEGYKHFPGVSCVTVASKLVSDTMREVNLDNHNDGMKAMLAKMDRFEEHLKKSTSQSENVGEGEAENTKDMINVFIKSGFVGNNMFNDSMISKIARMEKKNE